MDRITRVFLLFLFLLFSATQGVVDVIVSDFDGPGSTEVRRKRSDYPRLLS